MEHEQVTEIDVADNLAPSSQAQKFSYAFQGAQSIAEHESWYQRRHWWQNLPIIAHWFKGRRRIEELVAQLKLEKEALRRSECRMRESLEALLVMAEELVQLPDDIRREDQRIADTSTTDALTQHLAEMIRSVLACGRVSITTLDPDTQALRSTAVVGLPPELEKLWRERRPGYSLGEQLRDPSIDTRLHANEVIVVDMTKPSLRNRPNPYGISTMILAPMTIGKRFIGVLALDHDGQERLYTENDIALTKAVAELAALVIERDRLLAEATAARANELALRESTNLMDEFIGIAGHEIRTPLTSIKGSVQLAKRQLTKVMKHEEMLSGDTATTIAKVQELLDRAERQIGMQNRLVGDLLDVTRIRSNRLELHPELCDVLTIVRQVVEDQHYLTSTRTIRLKVLAQKEMLVMADADRLGQVVSNYLSNALKYSEASKPVEVCVEQEGTYVRVAVRDEGPGLSTIEQQRIWERFYRADGVEVKSGSGVGLGLGLHICKMIIERQDGSVGVESTPGHGSVFWFRLPLVEPDNAEAS